MKKILLVEDNADNRDLICAFLEGLYEVVTRETAPEVLEHFQDRSVSLPDLFLLDIALPGMDGVELLKRLHADERLAAIPAMALTAHAMKGDEQNFLAAGFDAYFSKPIIDDALLLKKIAGLIGR